MAASKLSLLCGLLALTDALSLAPSSSQIAGRGAPVAYSQAIPSVAAASAVASAAGVGARAAASEAVKNNNKKLDEHAVHKDSPSADLHVGSRAKLAGAGGAAGAAGAVAADPEDGGVKNKALKVSPQDKVYDSHKIDDDEKFHAPSLAPNDIQQDTKDVAAEEKKVEKTTAGEAEKGSKGSMILDDYDPTRLGVSADEAHNAKKNAKSKDKAAKVEGVKDTTKDSKFEVGGKKTKPAKDKDGKQIVEENKSDPQQRAKNLADSKQKKLESDEAERKEAESLKAQSDLHGAPGTAAAAAAAAAGAGATFEDPESYMARLIGSMLMIVVSEIGDKTFFIAALMAMRHKPAFVFSSSYSAMVFMTVLSMALGLILPSILSRKVTTLLAAMLFLVFGFKLVREAWGMDKSLAADEELAEVEQDLEFSEKTKASEKAEGGGYAADNTTRKLTSGVSNLASLIFSPAWIQIFAMTFLGEWGDRSQIATVAMGAGEGWLAVLTGCLAGHFITTLIAVMGGKLLAKQLSMRTITFSGAFCFFLFAIFYFKDWLDEQRHL